MKIWNVDTVQDKQCSDKFPYRRSVTDFQLLDGLKKGTFSAYVHCDIEVPGHLQNKSTNFPPIFKNTFVSKNNIEDLMKIYAEEEGFISQSRTILISIFSLKNETLITPLLLIHLDLGLICTTRYRFVEYIPENCFNSFVKSAVNARRRTDENPNSGVFAETMKLLANSFSAYQILDRSRHTLTKFLSDEKRHAAISNIKFRRLGFLND